MDGQEIEQLPAELEERIQADLRTGLLFRRERGRGTTGIVWRRGESTDPNPLAEAIIDKVAGEPFPLTLAEHRYEIRRLD